MDWDWGGGFRTDPHEQCSIIPEGSGARSFVRSERGSAEVGWALPGRLLGPVF